MDKEILHKYIIGDASPEEKEAVTRWVDADKENMEEYLALRKLYNITIWQQEPDIMVDRAGTTENSRHIRHCFFSCVHI